MAGRDDLDLENLAMPACFSDPKAMAAIKPPKEGGLTDEEIAAISAFFACAGCSLTG